MASFLRLSVAIAPLLPLCACYAVGRLACPDWDVGTLWDGKWDGCKSENRPCLLGLGRWDGCTPPKHPHTPGPPPQFLLARLQFLPRLTAIICGQLPPMDTHRKCWGG